MDQTAEVENSGAPDYQQAWQRAAGQLRMELSRAQYETWVASLQPVGYRDSVFTLAAGNQVGKDWVVSHLKPGISRLLGALMSEPVELRVVVRSPFDDPETEPSAPAETPAERGKARRAPAAGQAEDGEGGSAPSRRKLMLQRAYGSKRAQIIQPDRGMFVTNYFFNNWVPLIGQSAMVVILAARSMCYWNPLTGELRNSVETDMADLARRASVSVRTVKEVLNNELVQRYFLRYRVRRNMTPNGVRTAGISLLVRMDDPVTPQDQVEADLQSEDDWYLASS